MNLGFAAALRTLSFKDAAVILPKDQSGSTVILCPLSFKFLIVFAENLFSTNRLPTSVYLGKNEFGK